MSKLEEDIKSALMYGMDPATIEGMSQEEVIEEKSRLLSESIKDFLMKQEFRITEMEVPLDVEHIKTSAPIDGDVKPNTLLGPYGPVIDLLKKLVILIPGGAQLIGELESKLMIAASGVSGGGSTIPALFLKDGKDGGDLDVKGVSVMSEKSGGDSPSKLSRKTIIKLFKNDIKRADK